MDWPSGLGLNLLWSCRANLTQTNNITRVHYTYNVLLRIARNLLVIRIIIQIVSHPLHFRNFDWYSRGWSKKMGAKDIIAYQLILSSGCPTQAQKRAKNTINTFLTVNWTAWQPNRLSQINALRINWFY